MQISRRKSEEIRKQQGNAGPIHLTEDGFRRLKEQLARLKEAMPGLISEAQRTAAYGDRSDNAEYKEAKSTLRRAQGRIFNIEDQIKRVVVISSGPNASGKVRLGSTVVIDDDGVQKIFQILDSQETNPAQGRISYKSPLGAALMNHEKGDTVTISLPGAGSTSSLQGGGTARVYRIIEVR